MRKYPRRIFTTAELTQARAMRQARATWSEVGAALHCDYATIRRAIEPGYAADRARQIAARKKGESYRSLGRRQATGNVEVPEFVLVDRDIRSAAPRTITALLCGDPPRGQSALDKRGSA